MLEYTITAEPSTPEEVRTKQSQFTMVNLYRALTERARRPDDTFDDFVFYMFVDDRFEFKPYRFTLCVREGASQMQVYPCLYCHPVFSDMASTALRSGYTANVDHIMTLLTKEEQRAFHDMVCSYRSRPKDTDADLLLQWVQETIIARTSVSLMEELRHATRDAPHCAPVVKRPRGE